MKHPHAELLKQLIEDTTLSVEVMAGANEWGPTTQGHVFHDTTGMRRYRIKPQPIKRPYIKIGARWVPEPMKVAPKDEAHYFVAHPDNLYHFTWGGDSYDFGWLKSNTCHLTREAAEAHLAALQELHAQSATLLTDEEARK